MQLNTSPLNTDVINGSGGLTYLTNLIVNSSITASFVKAAQTVKSVLNTSVVSLIKKVNKIVTVVQTSAVTLLKFVQLVRLISVVSTCSLVISNVLFRTLNITVTSVATLLKRINKLVTALTTSTITITKALSKFVTVVNTVIASVLKQVNKVIFKGYNLYTYSQDFSNAIWSKTNGATITSNATTAPNGTSTASKLVEATGTNFYGVVYNPPNIPFSNTYTHSIYAKAAERTQIAVSFTVVPNGYASFDLSSGVTTSGSGATSTITSVGNGWYRCTTTITTASSGSNLLYGIVTTNTGMGSGTVVGIAGYGVYLWGAQLEKQSAVGPYVETTSSAYLPATITLLKQVGKLIVTSVVTSLSSITKNVGKLIVALVSSIVTIPKYYSKVLLQVEVIAATIITAVNRLVTLLAYSSSTSSITKQARKIISSVSTVIVTLSRRIGKLITYTSTSVVSILKALTRLFTIVSTITPRLIKSVLKPLTKAVTNTVTLVRSVLKQVIATVISTVTLVYGQAFFRVLSVVSATTVIFVISWSKVLTISVNCGIILSKLINKQLTIVSALLISLLANVISFVNYAVNKVIYARNSVRDQARIRFDTIIEASSKLRQATSVKFRTLFINKDSQV